MNKYCLGDRAERSFGDCKTGDGNICYKMLVPIITLRLYRSIGGTGKDDGSVQIVVNGALHGAYPVHKGQRRRSTVEFFHKQFPVNMGDIINFRTLLTSDVRVG